MAGAVEAAPILPGYAHFPAGLLNPVNGFVVRLAPFGAVDKEHVGSLGTGDFDSLKMILDIIAGIIDIPGEDLAELVGPLDRKSVV